MCQSVWTVDYSVYKWVGIGLWIGDIFLSINSVYLFICLQRTDWGLMFPEILLDFDQAALVWPQLFDLHFEHCGVREFGVRTCPESPKLVPSSQTHSFAPQGLQSETLPEGTCLRSDISPGLRYCCSLRPNTSTELQEVSEHARVHTSSTVGLLCLWHQNCGVLSLQSAE